jgi:hypothetical protein
MFADASRARQSTGGSLGMFATAGGAGGVGGGGYRPMLQVPPSPQRLPRGALHGSRFPM